MPDSDSDAIIKNSNLVSPETEPFAGLNPFAAPAPLSNSAVALPFKPFSLEDSVDSYDLVILGGGLAGLTLAIQVKQSCPDSTILVVEKQQFPRPEAAFKVGESTQEVAALYLSKVLGLKEHLEECQLPKFGVRFFFSSRDNQDISRRVEAGRTNFSHIDSYQIDRGRFENKLAGEARKLGVTLLENTKAREVALDKTGHRIKLDFTEGTSEVEARWLVDATGRGSLLKRQLGLQKESGHNVNAVWFRVKKEIDVGAWSDSPEWHSRPGNGQRRFSTNHLVGKGYWIWFIPLASGSTSVGIVSDASLHSFNDMNRFDRALDWLKEFEPQCARVIEDCREDLQDFKVLKHFSYSATRVYSADRWGLTGEAGVFLDPLYSPGNDFIAVSNTCITDLVKRDLAGENITERANWYNQVFLSLFDSSMLMYKDQYAVFGNSQVFMAKLVWDAAMYWGFPALFYYQSCWGNLDFMRSVLTDVRRCTRLQNQMQQFFRDWDSLGNTDFADMLVKYQDIDFLKELTLDLVRETEPEKLKTHFKRNIDMLEALARAITAKAVALHPTLAAKVNLAAAPGPVSAGREIHPDPAMLKALEEIWFDLRQAQTPDEAGELLAS